MAVASTEHLSRHSALTVASLFSNSVQSTPWESAYCFPHCLPLRRQVFAKLISTMSFGMPARS